MRSADAFKEGITKSMESRGCLGCCSTPTPITAVDEPSKGLKIQGRRVKKAGLTEDFWSTSTYEMENSGVQSQRSISSISISNQILDSHCGPSNSNATEFVFYGGHKFVRSGLKTARQKSSHHKCENQG
ncbi:hypothetical protein EJ110_NYTH28256 [Nymphaea thermarum]|nr:hypothetical protein EJ110_NYTH28256 [Nymphaea thermarum]